MELSFFAQCAVEHVGQAGLEQLRQVFGRELPFQFGGLSQLGKKLIQVCLQGQVWAIILHMHYERGEGRLATTRPFFSSNFWLLFTFFLALTPNSFYSRFPKVDRSESL